MARVTPTSVVYAILLSIVVISLSMPALTFYANPVAQTANSTYTTLNSNFMRTVYAPTYSYTFNSSSGLKASGALQQFTGLAFMFGAMFQVSSSAMTGIPMLQMTLGSVAQYAPLPGGDILALIGLIFIGAGFLLIWFFVASWTKVEA